MTKVLIYSYSALKENLVKITGVFLIGCLFFILIYVVNVYRVITQTVALQKIQNQTAELSTDLERLDSQYLTLSADLTPDNLAAYDMKVGHVSQYISRSASLGRVAVGGHEL